MLRIGFWAAVSASFFSRPAFCASEKKNLVIVADEWCPFNCAMESLDQGFMIDMAREILAAESYNVVYRTQAWTNALDNAAKGKVDAIVGASRDEAAGLIIVEEPLGENKNCFYTAVDDPFVYRGEMNLATRRLAVAAGYLYGQPLDEYIDKHRSNYNLLQLATGDHPLLQNIRKLKARRVDTVIENSHVMDYSLRKYRISDVRLAGCDAATPLFMAISPSRDDAGKLASVLAKGIRRMRQVGKMRELLARYGLSDWK